MTSLQIVFGVRGENPQRELIKNFTSDILFVMEATYCKALKPYKEALYCRALNPYQEGKFR